MHPVGSYYTDQILYFPIHYSQKKVFGVNIRLCSKINVHHLRHVYSYIYDVLRETEASYRDRKQVCMKTLSIDRNAKNR